MTKHPTLAEHLAPISIAEIQPMNDAQIAELMGATADEMASVRSQTRRLAGRGRPSEIVREALTEYLSRRADSEHRGLTCCLTPDGQTLLLPGLSGREVIQRPEAYVVAVVESFGYQAPNADLTEAVEEGADFFGGPVDLVGVLVEEGEEQLFAALTVAVLAGWAGPAGEVLDGPVHWGGLVDAELAEPVVNRSELLLLPEDDAAEFADDVGYARRLGSATHARGSPDRRRRLRVYPRWIPVRRTRWSALSESDQTQADRRYNAGCVVVGPALVQPDSA